MEEKVIVENKKALRSSFRIRSIKKHIFCYVMLSPALFGFFLYYVYVNINSILMAFDVVEIGGAKHFGFDNFIYLFREFTYGDSFFSSALLRIFITFDI